MLALNSPSHLAGTWSMLAQYSSLCTNWLMVLVISVLMAPIASAEDGVLEGGYPGTGVNGETARLDREGGEGGEAMGAVL